MVAGEQRFIVSQSWINMGGEMDNSQSHGCGSKPSCTRGVPSATITFPIIGGCYTQSLMVKMDP